MTMDLLAIDLGKLSFHLHGVDADGVVISQKVSRTKLVDAVNEMARKTIVMEACASPIIGAAGLWATVEKFD